MSDFRKCPVCGEYGWFDMQFNKNHTCALIWEARIYTRKYEEDWHTVHANDAEQAAAKFCETYDQNGEYDIVRRGGEEIEVRKSDGDKVIIVDIEAETVPHYYGHERKVASDEQR